MSYVGRQIGRYRILEQLGQGGMSVVYKGLDTALEREVAVKVLHPHLSHKEESRRRLAREARAVAKLRHPNILEVFDFAGVDSEEAYIVTEYIRGQTLRQYAAQTTFDPPEIAAMVIHEIAAALAHAHEAGVIHRDLKPENVMVREDGVLKLMDFGIAKIIDRDEKMTMTGALVGSPAHMAPEIIEGEEAGPEADVFSLGTMLFLFATGRLPFTAPNTTATLKKILDGLYEDPRQLVPTLSDDLAEIIATCLVRQPSSRYPSAGKLRDALAEYLSGVGFPRVSEELASFFADPPSFRKQLVGRLTQALVDRGERLIGEKRPAKALACLNQVLALDGGNSRALGLLQQMNLSRKRQRAVARSLKAALATLSLLAVASAGFALFRLWNRAPDYFPEPITRGTDVLVPASVYPAPPRPPPPPSPPAPVRAAPAPAVLPSPPPLPVKPPAPALVSVSVAVRPFGFVLVDGQRATRGEESAKHELKVLPGEHSFSASCSQFCVGDPKPVVTQVLPGGANEVKLAVVLKPSRLAFEGFPPDALVSARGESRKAQETQDNPIPVEGPTREGVLKHVVDYELIRPGQPTLGRRILITPGATHTVRPTDLGGE